MCLGPSFSRQSSSSSGYYNLPPRAASSTSNHSFRPASSLSLSNPTYKVLKDDEDKWICEIPVEPIFMQHTVTVLNYMYY